LGDGLNGVVHHGLLSPEENKRAMHYLPPLGLTFPLYNLQHPDGGFSK
jgi:hypothetical protein